MKTMRFKRKQSKFMKIYKILLAFAQGVSDHGQCAPYIDSFHFSNNCFETFAIEADANRISVHFFEKEQLTKIEQHCELELLFLV